MIEIIKAIANIFTYAIGAATFLIFCDLLFNEGDTLKLIFGRKKK